LTHAQASVDPRVTAIAVLRSLRKEGRLLSLYGGFFSTLARDLPYAALELGVYRTLQAGLRRKAARREGLRAVEQSSGSAEWRRNLLAAAVAGAAAAGLTAPMDLVRTRLLEAHSAAPLAAGGTALSVAARYIKVWFPRRRSICAYYLTFT
jgi:hypothetical protein